MAKTRVVVVDDSALVRGILSQIINAQPVPFYPAMKQRAFAQIFAVLQRGQPAGGRCLDQRPRLLSDVTQVVAARAIGKIAQAVLAQAQGRGIIHTRNDNAKRI